MTPTKGQTTTEAKGATTWCEAAGVANCEQCRKQLLTRLCANYPKPPKGLSYRQVDDLEHFGPDWREKPYNVHWPTIEALMKRGVIEKQAGTNRWGHCWMFRRVMPATTGAKTP